MPLDWKDRLQPATYRGVPFLVVSHDLEGGRRGSVQEFPQRDDPYVEDLGRRARRFRLEAVLLGSDYMTQRDRLIEVCSSRAPGFPRKVGGLLTHPYLGNLRVFCLSYRVRESIPEGRMARVSLEFVEAGDAPGPTRSSTAAAEAETAADAAGARAEEVTVETLDTTGPESVRDAIAGELRKVGQTLDSLDVFSGPAREVALLARDVDALLTQATALAKSPADAAAQVRQALGRIKGAVSRTADAAFAYEALFGLEATQIGGKGGTGTQADANARVVIDQARQTAVAELAAVLAAAEWETHDEAVVAREDLVGKLEDLLEGSDPSLQVTLSRLLSLASSTIPPIGQRLPRVLELELPFDTPALVLAYQLYDDADRDQELADRAGVAKPGFLPGGVPIPVLSDA